MIERHSFPVLIALAVLWSSCASAPPAAVHAEKLLDEHRFDEALETTAAALADHPRSAALWRVRVRAHMASGDHKAAGAHYKSWHDLRGDHDVGLLGSMAITILRQSLSAGNAATRAHAITIIEHHEIEQFAESVADRLGDDDDVVAATASVAILKSHPQAPDVLDEMLTSDNPHARAIAVAGLGRKLGRIAADPIGVALGDRAAIVRRAALTAWNRYRRASDKPTVLLLAQKDTDHSVRARALRILARAGNGDAVVKAAQRALKDKYVGANLAALQVLTKRRDKTSVQSIENAVEHKNALVSLEAALALKRLQNVDPAHVFVRHMNAESWTVRASVLGLVQRTEDRALAMSLAGRGLADPNARVQIAAARLLLRHGTSTRATEALKKALSAADEGLRLLAALSLASNHNRLGSSALSALAQSHNSKIQARAVDAHNTYQLISIGAAMALAAPSSHVRLLAADWVLRTVN